jgi:asparagine synthase (glutamine-hydrolysing)
VDEMCGITGFIGFEDKTILKRMCDIIHHRGPNDRGIYSDNNVSLGSLRLSIIDLASGHQPIHNEDESVWITYNGEIYNYLVLKKELETLGHRFYTDTDTEVIVHAYEEYGEKCVEKLRGMFAFALWDSDKKQVLLARDRMGIKPLYYYFDGERLIFASEIKPILLCGVP